MSKKKVESTSIQVQGTGISILSGKDGDYISLTDMMRAKDGDFFISDWLETVTRWNFLASGSPFSILILIMANSP